MNLNTFNNGLIKLQSTFNSTYTKDTENSIFETVKNWSETTFEKAIIYIKDTFVPYNSCLLPVPAHFTEAKSNIYINEYYEIKPKPIDEPEDIEGFKKYKEETAKILTKLKDKKMIG